MNKTISTLLLLWGGLVVSATTAQAQYPAVPGAMPFTSPAVSPYVNLGTYPNGISNYPTLVRPMLDEREALLRQSLTIQQLEQQLRNPRNAPPARVGGAPAPQKSRTGADTHFQNTTHFFGR